MTSVLMPGILSRARAKAIVTASRYRDRKRSFVNATRAGECGSRGFEAYKVAQDRETACIATIEDLEAVLIDDILLVRGHDAIFIGRGDLAAALGCKTIEAPRTKKAVSIMMAGALRHRIPAIAINGDDAEAMAAPRSTDIHDRFRPSLHVQIYARRSYDAYGSKKGE
jgi:2-keto-3-deoxy-L-rhamnonate aldolase RhmA